MASAASTAPMRPFVSTSPSASCATCVSSRETVAHRLRVIAPPQVNPIAFQRILSGRNVSEHHDSRTRAPAFVRLSSLSLPPSAWPRAAAVLQTPGPTDGDAERHAQSRPRAGRKPAADHLQVRRRLRREVRRGLSRVFVHVVDTDDEQMWDDDHNPPVPTTQWKPGQTVEYTRTLFVPVFPYVGDATIQVGLHSLKDQQALTLAGDDAGQHSYKVAHTAAAAADRQLFTVFKDGWHPAENGAARIRTSSGSGPSSRRRSRSRTRRRTRSSTSMSTVRARTFTARRLCRSNLAGRRSRRSRSSRTSATCTRSSCPRSLMGDDELTELQIDGRQDVCAGGGHQRRQQGPARTRACGSSTPSSIRGRTMRLSRRLPRRIGRRVATS